ncbi:MAG: hypothetical protein B6242_04930 [Anaerolineaceae bacterium 4572_78]|nr:MAG: hypothetical protein B6242_04930 [Anaerolineaceae bacterium 4572_78]
MKILVEQYLDFTTVQKKYAENTVIAYRNDLYQFMTIIQDEINSSWLNVNNAMINNYIIYLEKEEKFTASTIARKVAAIKSFFNYLVAKGMMTEDENPTEDLNSPKVEKRLPQAISVEEINRLLNVKTYGDTPKSFRDRAILELLYASGMRVTELCSLNVQDIDFENGTVRVKGKNSGIQERFIPLSEESQEIIGNYVKDNRQHLIRSRDDSALFLNHRGQRLTRQGLWLIIKYYVQKVGIAEKVTPHTLRHSFAAHRLSLGKSLEDLQKLLGHANISTTQIYTHLPAFEIIK